jgi:hypothetical protein
VGSSCIGLGGAGCASVPCQRAEVSHAAGSGAGLTVFFKNVTVWGPAAQALVRDPGGADILAVAEHHVGDDGVDSMLETWGGAHWLAVASPARRSARAAAAGGVAVGARRHLAARSYRHWACRPAQTVGLGHAGKPSAFVPGAFDFWDFAAVSVAGAAGCRLTIVSFYATDGIGMAGDNLTKFGHLGAFLSMVGEPWIVVADWNMVPEQLAASRWLSEVGGRVLVPDNTDYTCNVGARRMLDYAVAGNGGEQLVKRIWADLSGGGHMGVFLELEWSAVLAEAWQLPCPRAFRHPAPACPVPAGCSRRQLRAAVEGADGAPVFRPPPVP